MIYRITLSTGYASGCREPIYQRLYKRGQVAYVLPEFFLVTKTKNADTVNATARTNATTAAGFLGCETSLCPNPLG